MSSTILSCIDRWLIAQTTNLIINLDHDEWILDDDSKVLVDVGFGMYRLRSFYVFSVAFPAIDRFVWASLDSRL